MVSDKVLILSYYSLESFYLKPRCLQPSAQLSLVDVYPPVCATTQNICILSLYFGKRWADNKCLSLMTQPLSRGCVSHEQGAMHTNT